MSLSRRVFMKGGALAVFGSTAVPAFLTRAVLAQSTTAQAKRKTLVVIFERGAADGLNLVVPHAEKNYYKWRPTIAVPRNQVIDLDGFFGLHPALAPFKPLYDHGHLAMVQACGSPNGTRSHFDAQDYMESGTPGVKSTTDGWLNRAMQDKCSCGDDTHSPFDAVALGSHVPRTLEGKFPAVAMTNLQRFSVGGQGRLGASLSNTFQSMYDDAGDSQLESAGKETFAAIRMLKAVGSSGYRPAAGASYPNTQFGGNMKQIAQLIKANLGVEAAFTDIGGWDTHQHQGNVDGRLAAVLRDFSQGISAFWTDMGDQADNVVLVTMSEFGRTVHENGSAGTDHGHANVMFVLGGPVRGGKVYGKWPGLSDGQLYQDRDLAITTDFRQVLGEAAYRTLGARKLDLVFPNSGVDPSRFLNLI